MRAKDELLRFNFSKAFDHKFSIILFRIVGCTHINAQTAVLVETLVALGAQVTSPPENVSEKLVGN